MNNKIIEEPDKFGVWHTFQKSLVKRMLDMANFGETENPISAKIRR